MNEIIERLFSCLNAGDYAALADMVTDDAVFEVPYADLLVEGREEFVKVFSETTAVMFDGMTLTIDHIYMCERPAPAVVVEYRSTATLRSTQRPYSNRYAGIFLIRDGRIALWREYFNPQELKGAQPGQD
jgi:uncharacterized protein